MAANDVEIRGLSAQAKRAAQRRNQTLSTAHLLLVMVQNASPAARFLHQQDLHESKLLQFLHTMKPEHGSLLQLAMERAQQLAESLETSQVNDLHLLLTLTRMRQSAAHAYLAQHHEVLPKLVQALSDALGLSAATSTPPPRRASPPPAFTQGYTPRINAVGSGQSSTALRPLTNMRAQAMTLGRSVALKSKEERDEESSTTNTGEVLYQETHPPVEHAPNIRRPKKEAAPSNETEEPPGLELNPKHFPVLTRVGRNLSSAAANGEFDPLVGRDALIDQMLDILARRRAHNPLLLGPPGVGKTALVEGLAMHFIQQPIDAQKGPTIVIELSAGALIAGTGVRGALAERLRQVQDEVQRASQRVIIFIDEIHSIVGNGDTADDLANELKSILARNTLHCIGATTEEEYHRSIARDPALARRFSHVHVDEPSTDTTVAILQGIKHHYESHHQVNIDEEAIQAAVSLSRRYVVDRYLPDKALSILDLAGAQAKRRGQAQVSHTDVATIVAARTHIPAERLLMEDAERLLALEQELHTRIVGHERCIERIASSLRRAMAGFRSGQPLATFLFLGPSGVGKTETAKAIQDILFAQSNMARFDMSSYNEAHSVARLFGAPPGYVGHDVGGQLTESVQRRPYQLILLDEIEKAHPQVWLSLLPLLDEGYLTDAKGRHVDFSNTVICMTSNLGASLFSARSAPVGFANHEATSKDQHQLEARVLDHARQALPDELWNRIDETLVFHPLSAQDTRIVTERLLEQMAEQLRAQHQLELYIDDTVIDHVLDHGEFDLSLGARPMRRTIGRLVEAPLAAAIFKSQFPSGSVVYVAVEEGELQLSV